MPLPVYDISCFKLPKETCKKIKNAMIEFRWSSDKDKRKIPWVSWCKLCRQKKQGGLGFRDIGQFNQALLCKQSWKIWDQPQSLLSRILKGRYFKNGSLLECDNGTRLSYAWRSILFGRELLLKGLVKSLGHGRDTEV